MSAEQSLESCEYFANDRVTLYEGDCIEVMRGLPDNSVDSIVTDPPYGLEFMGKDWDKFKTGRSAAYSSGGSLTHTDFKNMGTLPSYTNRPAKRCGICGKQAWSGSPCKCPNPQWVMDNSPLHSFQNWFTEVATEALRVLKPGGHLLAFGGTRTWHRLASAIEDAGFEVRDSIAWMYGSGFPKSHDVSKGIDKAAGAQREVIGTRRDVATRIYDMGEGVKLPSEINVTAPATPAAQQWQGWGTALKPAHEPIVVARKPLIGTVAANVLTHGTGALNIDGCRVDYQSDADKDKALAGDAFKRKDTSDKGWSRPWMQDAERVERMNREAKERAQGGRWPANVILDESQAAALDKQGDDTSRFFYCPKAGKSERPNVDGVAHPTVKPLALMRYLCKLVTPPGGTILEPFSGSGTTIEAALLEGFNVIGIEMTEEYLPLIMARIERYDEGMF